MAGFSPKTPVVLQIRRIIFENYNDVDGHFTNDDVFRILRDGGDVDPGWTVGDIEPHINEICGSGMARNIAQNLTTVWLKLFDVVERRRCDACGLDVFLARSEDGACPNPSCGARL